MDKSSNPTLADKALRGLRHIGSARLIIQLFTWGLTAVVIHLLKPRDYGLVATAGLVTSFGQLLLDGGLRDVLVSQRLLTQRIEGAALTVTMVISLVVGAITFCIAPLVSDFFHSASLRSIIEVLAFYLPLTSLEVIPAARLSKQLEFARVAILQTVSTIAQGVGTLILAYLGMGYWALILGTFLGTAIRVALFWVSLDRRPRPNFQLGSLRPLVRSGSHLMGQRITFFGIDNFDIFLLSRFGGPAILGPYSVARSLAHSAIGQIPRVVNQVLLPTFAAKDKREEQLQGLLAVSSLAAVVFFPLFWIGGVASQTLIPMIFGSRWSNVVIPFLAFSVIIPLRGLYSLLNSSVIGTGRTGTTFKNALIWAAIIMPSMALGLNQGANGVALSWCIAFPAIFYIALKRISAAFSANVSMLLRPMFAPAACAAVGSLAAEGLKLSLSSSLPAPILLGCECSLGGVCYWGLIRTFSRAQYSRAVVVVRRMLVS